VGQRESRSGGEGREEKKLLNCAGSIREERRSNATDRVVEKLGGSEKRSFRGSAQGGGGRGGGPSRAKMAAEYVSTPAESKGALLLRTGQVYFK